MEELLSVPDEHLYAKFLELARDGEIVFDPKPDIRENIKDLYFLLRFNHIEIDEILETSIWINYLKIDPSLIPPSRYDEAMWYLYQYRDRLNTFFKMALNVDAGFWVRNSGEKQKLFNQFFIDRKIEFDEDIPLLRIYLLTLPRTILEDTRSMLSHLTDIEIFEFAFYAEKHDFYLYEVEIEDFMELVK